MPRYVFATLAESPQTTLSSMVTLPSVGLCDDEEMAAVIVDPFSSSLNKPEPQFISSDHGAHIFVDPRISKLCRSCGKENEDMINIFTDESEAMLLPEKIQDVLSIPVSRMDERPQQMCEPCIASLELAHKFRLEYLKAEDHFCKLLQSPVVDEIESSVAASLLEMESEEEEAEIPKETIIISVVNDADTATDTLTFPTTPVTPDTASTPVTPDTASTTTPDPHATPASYGTKKTPSFKSSEHMILERAKLVKKYRKYDANCPNDLHCLVCNMKHKNVSSLVYHHLRQHTRSQLFLCIKCFQDFKLKEDFEAHVSEYHSHDPQELSEVWSLPNATKPKRQLPTCLKCNISFKNKSQYTNHYLSVHKTHFKCSECGKVFGTNEDWKNHRRRHNPRHKSRKREQSCTYCDFTTKYKQDLNDHLKEKHSELLPKFTCDPCGKVYATKILLKCHINQTHNTVGRTHLCEQCGESFKHKITLTQHKYRHMAEAGKRRMECAVCSKHVTVATFVHHMSRHITKTPYSCPICKVGIALKTNLERHMNSHKQGGNEFQCLLCKVVVTNKKELSEHKLKHMNGQKTFSCPICNEICKSYQGMVAHCRNLHDPKQLREYYKQNPDITKNEPEIAEEPPNNVDTTVLNCNFCEHKAKDVADYFSHRKTHEESFTLKCEFCTQRFVTMRSRNAHVLGHSNIKPFPCDQCSASFGCKDYLRTHQLQKHKSENILNCTYCEKVFHSQKYFQRHLNTHEKQNNRPVYECGNCHKKYKNKIVYEKHMQSYTRKEIPNMYECSTCNKKFKVKLLFEKHLKTHTNVVLYECNDCNKKFKSKSKCEQHMKTHRDTKTFECTLCLKELKSKVSLEKHMKSHTRVEVHTDKTTVFVVCPFQCKGCGKAFTSKKHKLKHESTCNVKIDQVVVEEGEIDDTVRVIVDAMYD